MYKIYNFRLLENQAYSFYDEISNRQFNFLIFKTLER